MLLLEQLNVFKCNDSIKGWDLDVWNQIMLMSFQWSSSKYRPATYAMSEMALKEVRRPITKPGRKARELENRSA